MNTRKIKVIFSEHGADYGTKIQIKCHKPIDRIDQTLDDQKCVNWEFMDSFGIKSVDLFNVKKFYYSVNWRNIGLRLTI